MEQSLCRTYYQKHDSTVIKTDGSVPEGMCKSSQLQADLSELSGWYDFFVSLPGEYSFCISAAVNIRVEK